MAEGRRPTVQRFNRKETYAGRDVKRTVVSRRVRTGVKGREGRSLKPLR